MPAKTYPPVPTFDEAYTRATGYRVSTPFGVVSILNEGRRIIFDLYPDVRQSIHHKALFTYVQSILKQGADRFNVSHLDLDGLDPDIDLRRGKARLDFVYFRAGKIYEVELKTHREIGLDVTGRQLFELAKNCEHLIIVVPLRDRENMRTVLQILEIQDKCTIDTYDVADIPLEAENDY